MPASFNKSGGAGKINRLERINGGWGKALRPKQGTQPLAAPYHTGSAVFFKETPEQDFLHSLRQDLFKGFPCGVLINTLGSEGGDKQTGAFGPMVYPELEPKRRVTFIVYQIHPGKPGKYGPDGIAAMLSLFQLAGKAGLALFGPGNKAQSGSFRSKAELRKTEGFFGFGGNRSAGVQKPSLVFRGQISFADDEVKAAGFRSLPGTGAFKKANSIHAGFVSRPDIFKYYRIFHGTYFCIISRLAGFK
jgi:hypothetical protein